MRRLRWGARSSSSRVNSDTTYSVSFSSVFSLSDPPESPRLERDRAGLGGHERTACLCNRRGAMQEGSGAVFRFGVDGTSASTAGGAIAPGAASREIARKSSADALGARSRSLREEMQRPRAIGRGKMRGERERKRAMAGGARPIALPNLASLASNARDGTRAGLAAPSRGGRGDVDAPRARGR